MYFAVVKLLNCNKYNKYKPKLCIYLNFACKMNFRYHILI